VPDWVNCDDVSEIGVIYFKRGSFCIKKYQYGEDRDTSFNAYASICTFEVLGNDYQSRELLEGAK